MNMQHLTDKSFPRRNRKSILGAAMLAAAFLIGGSDVNGQPAATQPATRSVNPTTRAARPATQPVAAPAPVALQAAPDAQPSMLDIDSAGGSGKISLSVNKSAVIRTIRNIDRVSVGNPDIADVNVIASNSVLLTAKKTGSTQLIVWDEVGRTQMIDIDIVNDLAQLQDQLTKLFPDSKIEVSAAAGAIALNGRVPNLEVAQQAAQLAAPYSSGENKVLNFLEISGGQQVMLMVKFAEVSRSATNALGVNFGFTDGTAIGGTATNGVPGFSVLTENRQNFLGVPQSGAYTLFANAEFGGMSLTALINAMRQNNLMRLLAEPNLTAISGQEAQFLAGGEFPIPVPQSTGGGTAITVEYQEFGVKLKFTPIVLGNGKIRLKATPEVSDLDFSSGVVNQGFRIPIINKRSVTTTVELAEGQTFALAGLLSNQVSASRDVTPLLGDIPILGNLFRSVRYERKETELVVLVTPHLVAPMNPGEVPQLPGEKWRYPNEGELFWDHDLGGPVTQGATTQPTVAEAPPKFQGEFGFAPVATTDLGE